MAKEAVVGVEGITPGIIVRHTSRRLGDLEPCEACERLISGSISFSEFVDQAGDGFRELLDFMTEYDLHPGRPEDVVFCMDCHADPVERMVLRSQLEHLYNHEYPDLKAG